MNIIIPIKRNRFPIVFVISLSLTFLLTFNLIYTKTENIYIDGLSPTSSIEHPKSLKQL